MNSKPPNDKDNNIISLEDHKKATTQKISEPHDPPYERKEPFINLPAGVKGFCGLFLLVHIVIWCASEFSNDNMLFWSAIHWGFIPARFTGEAAFLPYTVFTPLTYALFHGGWAHLLINTVMLAAFGTGFEKTLGFKKLLTVFWGSVIIAAGVHFILDPQSMAPMVGASGGVSGLFAGMILIMHRSGQMTSSKRLLPIIMVFVVISILFGFLGGPDGSIVAWAAHIGGFLGGLLLTHIILKKGQ